MLNPSTIGTAFRDKLRLIAALAAELGNANKINFHADTFPTSQSLQQALIELPEQSVLIAWEGTGPGRMGPAQVWRHNYGVYIRATNPINVFRLITSGVPAGDTLSLLYTKVHASVEPMDVPSIRRFPLPLEMTTRDLFLMPVSIPEFGDN